MTKSKKVACLFSSLFFFLFGGKNRLAISKMVNAQLLHKVLVHLKKMTLFFDDIFVKIIFFFKFLRTKPDPDLEDLRLSPSDSS